VTGATLGRGRRAAAGVPRQASAHGGAPPPAAGFTLLEIMVAIVLTGMVAVLAFGAARVSVDTRARLGRALADQQRARATQAFLEDALRNARRPRRPGEPGLELRDGRLAFVAAGTGPPLDPDYDWRVTIAVDSGGLDILATTVGRGPPTTTRVRVPDVTRWDVQALTDDATGWTRAWTDTTRLPAAVTISLWHDTQPIGQPLLVAIAAGGGTVAGAPRARDNP